MRRIPAALLAHLRSGLSTTCRLLLVTLTDGRQYGMCSLDQPITYRGITYSALQGFDFSIIATDTGLSVDNGEASALLAQATGGITYEMALAGDLDDATWEMLLVNYRDLTMGHMVVDAGDIGEVKTLNGVIYTPELLSYAMRLRQTIGHVWSRRCRADFGSPAEGQLGCGVDAESMWTAATVSAVDGDDPFRVFAAADLIGGLLYFPGRVRWATGRNASSRLAQVEASSTVSGTVALMESTAFPIEVGDTFEIRRDCNKSPSQCLAYGNFINYKGEPYIPVGDGLETMTPNAQVFGGLSGSQIVD